jgi:hypothetical protein
MSGLERNLDLTPDGIWMARTHHAVSYPTENHAEFQHLEWSDEDDTAGHYRRYRLGQLVQLAERHGVTVEYATYFFRVLPLPILLRRTLPTLLGRRSSQAETYHAEHVTAGGSRARLLDRLLAGEIQSVRRRRSMRIGSSCLLVGRCGVTGSSP